MEKTAVISKVEELHAGAERARTAYQWEDAIALYSQALEQPDLPPEVEYELLDGRAFSYQRVFNEQGRRSDLQRMLTLADQNNNPNWQVHALADLTDIDNDNGDLEPGWQKVRRILDIAQSERSDFFKAVAQYYSGRP